MSMNGDQETGPRFVVRRGPPWPFVRCQRCGCSRHFEPPRTSLEGEEIETDMVKFALAHKGCEKTRNGSLAPPG